MLYFALLLLITIVQIFCDDDLLISLPNGKIRGISVTPPVTGDLTYYAYLGIPFAAPPVGNLRFQPPQPVTNWEGILEANNNSVSCYQVDKEEKYQTEDCLYLNVYTPLKPEDTRKLPVLVSIYGGTFIHGHANYNNKLPAFLIRQDLILVTFNYRVGPFGFLSTDDGVISGNMGLKDQQFALKWVHDNIEYFGGDPQQVTIMGQSAGSASVTYNLISPGSKGLFRAAIGMSGSALCTWAYQRNAEQIAYGIAAEIDPTFNVTRSTEELLEFLVSVDASSIVATGNKYKVFAPVIEPPHEGAFISDLMYTLVENGTFHQVPVLMGFNSEEGIGVASDMESWKKRVQGYDDNPSLLVDSDMYIFNSDIKWEVGNKIRSIYVGDQPFGDNVGKAVQYYSDNKFIRAIIKFAELLSKHVDLHFYEFTYHGELGQNNISIPGIGKVVHGEDQKYFWAYYDNYDQYPESDKKVLQRYVTLMCNFVKYLNPTPTNDELFDNIIWPSVTEGDFTYLDIGENLNLYKNPRNFSYGSWVDLYEQYALKPYISF
ncbi:carboxylic ester hydrolase-like [Diorhabda sublineata]|uniref:carboxylic ester hydrolase-like n=1 Tax=Diorhabda sublineata TaxID=1163346 RepID=UPI0024E1604A|nr:carboxylic ester hydrolase-like [Diorhabda sublineata]